MRQSLEDEPYEIEVAADGRAALDAIAERRPDVILLDLLMPRMDGFEVIAALQQDPERRTIPVIVLTAKTLTRQEQRALKEHALAVIQKGALDRDALMAELKQVLPEPRAARAAGGHGMRKILIVEDVEYNRDLLVQLLEDDYEVLTATDGATGIEAAARERPDLILMDLSLPGSTAGRRPAVSKPGRRPRRSR